MASIHSDFPNQLCGLLSCDLQGGSRVSQVKYVRLGPLWDTHLVLSKACETNKVVRFVVLYDLWKIILPNMLARHKRTAVHGSLPKGWQGWSLGKSVDNDTISHLISLTVLTKSAICCFTLEYYIYIYTVYEMSSGSHWSMLSMLGGNDRYQKDKLVWLNVGSEDCWANASGEHAFC